MLFAPHTGPRWTGRTITAPNSFWNQPLPADASLSGETHDLAAQAKKASAAVNTTTWSCPLTVVPAEQPLVSVRLTRTDRPAKALGLVLAQGVPVPPDWEPQNDSDKSACFYQPDLDRLYELWRLRRDTTGAWCCDWGGRMSHVSQSPGYWVDRHTSWRDRTYPDLPADPVKAADYEEHGWGSTATSLPLAAGLLTLEDVQLGRVDHALGLAVIASRKGVFRAPAQRGDGWVDNAPVIEGMRLRLPATYDPAAIGHPTGRLVAQAARDYGLVVWDKAGALSVRAEPGVSGGWTALRDFPWDLLQVLAEPALT